MVASTDIKFYVHTNTNAPQLQNAYGSMINVLDACLVNGFGSQTVSTLTAIGTTVTATFGSAHKFMQYQVIKIVGAAQTEYNGEHRILTVPDANTLTFELAAVPSVTTATGTINCSLPPLGWEKPFSATGKAAYRSTNTLLSSRPYLRVVDELDPAYTATYAKYAKVGIVEDMTDIDTLLGVQAPYDSAAPDKNWVSTGSGSAVINGWARWYYARSSRMTNGGDTGVVLSGNRAWLLIGTSDHFYIMPTVIASDDQHLCYGFGSFESYISADIYNTFLSATNSYVTASNSTAKDSITPIANGSATLILHRSYTQTAPHSTAACVSLQMGVTFPPSGYNNIIAAAAVSGQTPQCPIFINDGTLRGRLKAVNYLYQLRPYIHMQIIGLAEQSWIAVNTASGLSGVTGQLMMRVA